MAEESIDGMVETIRELEKENTELKNEIKKLRKHTEQLTGEKFSERNHAALHFQIKELKSEVDRLTRLSQYKRLTNF